MSFHVMSCLVMSCIGARAGQTLGMSMERAVQALKKFVDGWVRWLAGWLLLRLMISRADQLFQLFKNKTRGLQLDSQSVNFSQSVSVSLFQSQFQSVIVDQRSTD